jgi:hypothetical protein
MSLRLIFTRPTVRTTTIYKFNSEHLPTSFIAHSRRTMASIQAAQDFLTFVDASPTPFHAVHSAKEKLEKAGFKHIKVGILLSPLSNN